MSMSCKHCLARAGFLLATSTFVTLASSSAHAALVRVMNAGGELYPSVAESGIPTGRLRSQLSPIASYSGVLWYEDGTDSFAPPMEGNIVFQSEANPFPSSEENVDVTISNSFPTNVSNGGSEGPPLFQIFGEQWNMELQNDIWIYPWTVSRSSLPDVLEEEGIQVDRGTRINSYYFFIDGLTPTTIVDPTASLWGNSPRLRAFGTFVFEEEILGVMGNRHLLASANSILGRDGVTYGIDGGLERQGSDIVQIEGNALTLDFVTHDTMDVIRVITKSAYSEVPEPMTILGSAFALGFGVLLKGSNKLGSQRNKK